MSEYLLELGMEEIPARFLLSLSEQLKTRVETFLREERLAYDAVIAYATPRRLAVHVTGLSEKQEDLSEKIKGPTLKIAKDENGEWTKAALGFVKGKKADVSDIVVENLNGEDYLYVNKFIEGASAQTVLGNIVQVIKAMTFPVTMIWNTNDVPFIRPIHWMISLLDDKVLPLEFVGVQASNTTKGHRFLGKETVIQHPSEYREKLFAQKVVVDFESRRQMIRDQIMALAQQHHWKVPIDEALLEEVTSIVEWPTAFSGTFDTQYLEVPRIVLITAMKDHQRYFYAEDPHNGELLPVFISVRNGNDQHLDNVIKGNNKVLVARLEDALFFYKEDLKHALSDFTMKLANVNEHYKLGSLEDKSKRVKKIVTLLSQQVQVDEETQLAAERASDIYKFDLMTQTVGEFDELQGQIGEIYARHYGESERVSRAIGTQYLPTTSGGALPDLEEGALLAISDKIDTLVQYFSVGLIPTGSNDPYALRRQATGIVEIILDQEWMIDLTQLFTSVVSTMDSVDDKPTLVAQLLDFINARIQNTLEKEAIDFDIIQAVLNNTVKDVVNMVKAARHLHTQKYHAETEYKEFVEAMTRVLNLGSKVTESHEIKLDLAKTDSERTLIQFVNALPIHTTVERRFTALYALSLYIKPYFDENKVNDDDATVKVNRLATMQKLTQYMLELADTRVLISKF